MNLEYKALPLEQLELKLGEKEGTFKGYSAVFGNKDLVNDIIVPGAFAKSLAERTRPMRIHFNHQLNMPIGLVQKASEDSRGLLVEGELTPGHSLASDIRAGMKHGTLDGMSIGYRIPEGGAEKKDGIRYLKSINLVEVSVVTSPANPEARIALDSVKSALDEVKTIRDMENFLREAAGFSKSAAESFIARARVVLGDPGSESTAGFTRLKDFLKQNPMIPRST